MVDYTFLVVEETREEFKKGTISAVQKGEGNWGAKECAPRFTKIAFDGTHDAKNFVYRCCKYDFENAQFIRKDTGEPFDAEYDVVPHVTDFGDQVKKDEQLAKVLIGEEKKGPCPWLRAKHMKDFKGDERSYWVAIYEPFRKITGVTNLIEAAKYGAYSDCRAAFNALDSATQVAIIESTNSKDNKYLRWLYLAKNKVEADNILTGE